MFRTLSLWGIGAGLILSASAANAALYTFSQTGFEENATISGSFQASDIDNDGLLEGGSLSSIQEISSFSITFSGNSLVSAFTHNLADLTVLFYRPAKSVLGDQNPEGLATNWFGTSGFTYVSGTAANGQQGGGIINWATNESTSTENMISVAPAAVPVPGAVWLFGTVLAGFFGAGGRKRR